ncbi:hypothetical protein [Glycomyces paridis]|uniref:Uncharacterized protein n=1 Tax=Glycomyces paridis TaxID=2126555 RepID=A0A4S8PC77_9ACTN|nr:hypothetical protein [Glycomyces paridis]THV27923.1 hypothetical protein E9998_13100 [Glycomyces paridis]
MSTYGIPAHIQSQLDQQHAAMTTALSELRAKLDRAGIGDLDAPERVIGIRTVLTLAPNTTRDVLLSLAAIAISHLYDTDTALLDDLEGIDPS